MMNLLPQDEKKKITREYHARLIVAALTLFGSAISAGIIMLIPSYTSLLLEEGSIALILGTPILEEQARAYDELSSELDMANKKLAILKKGADDIDIFENVITPITARRGSISILGITYEKNINGAKIVRVSGVAKDREVLRGFAKALEEEPYFERVEIPVSNFVKDRDIEFSLEIGVKK